MKKMLIGLTGVLVIFITGCGFWLRPGVEQKTAPRIIEYGKVFDKARLKQGGPLVVVPFTPGSEVRADDSQERVSLLVVKGIIEEFRQGNSPFAVVFNDEADKAGLAVRGYITKMEEPSIVKRWLAFKKEIVLSVKGEIINLQTRAKILVFKHTLSGTAGQTSFDDLARKMGTEIGKFVMACVP